MAGKSCCKKVSKSSISNFLRYISLGQYRTPLYYKGTNSYSSIIGGVITIFYVLAITAFAISTLVQII
jgi:hypothetical protein